jgi:hypothetical protein
MSIKLCVITPISHLETFEGLGEMSMVLSHLVLENGGDNPYANYYKKQREKGRFIILDNGAFECEAQGVGVGIDACLDAAEIIQPNEIIAEDVLYSGEQTLESTKRFIERMNERGMLQKYSIMAVVQGHTRDEWLTCLNRLMDMREVNTIGLSKLSVPISFLGEKESSGCVARSRVECVETIAKCYGWELNDPQTSLCGKRFHLLGGDNWLPWEIKQQTQYPWIRSNDSSAAVWYGMQMGFFNEEGKISYIITEKPDLENKDPETEKLLSRETRQRMILENIIRWHMAAKGE